MGLLGIVAALTVIGFALYLINKYIPVDTGPKPTLSENSDDRR